MNTMQLVFLVISAAITLPSLAMTWEEGLKITSPIVISQKYDPRTSVCSSNHCSQIRLSQQKSASNYNKRFKKTSLNSGRDCTKAITKNCDNGRES